MNKNIFLIVVIVGIIVISGCIQQNKLPSQKPETTTTPTSKESCESLNGVWQIWRDVPNAQPECNLPTSDSEKPCTDSSQCESYCKAPKGSEIGARVEGRCYGFKIAICMQEVKNGVTDAEWCY